MTALELDACLSGELLGSLHTQIYFIIASLLITQDM